MVKYKSLKELLIRLKDKSDRAKELENTLNTYLTPGKRSASLQSLRSLKDQVAELVNQFNNFGEGTILEVTFMVYYSPRVSQKYRKRFVNITPEEAEELVKYKYSKGPDSVFILEARVIPTSDSLEKL